MKAFTIGPLIPHFALKIFSNSGYTEYTAFADVKYRDRKTIFHVKKLPAYKDFSCDTKIEGDA